MDQEILELKQAIKRARQNGDELGAKWLQELYDRRTIETPDIIEMQTRHACNLMGTIASHAKKHMHCAADYLADGNVQGASNCLRRSAGLIADELQELQMLITD